VVGWVWHQHGHGQMVLANDDRMVFVAHTWAVWWVHHPPGHFPLLPLSCWQ
jgi:proteasome lid subunit RPN8/RPN11